MTLFNAQKLFASAPRVTDDDAERIRPLLATLDHPERKFRILPVTGEKGKSSVARMISGILGRSGISAVAVTLPCLESPRENVLLGDAPLSNEEFVTYTARIYNAVKKAYPSKEVPAPVLSQAELLFCLAAVAADAKDAKWLILELPEEPFAPLATVRFSAPITVITSCTTRVPATSVNMIHPGVSEVVSARPGSKTTYKEISEACSKAGSRLTIPALSALTTTESSLKRTAFTYRNTEYVIPLYGSASLSNALCAIEAATALSRLGCKITERGILEGLAHTALPARIEVLSVAPTIVVDAADDNLSAFTLADALKARGSSIGSSVTLCVEEGENAPYPFCPDPFSELLQETDFRITSVVRIERGKENRSATLLLNAAEPGDLILTVGTLPFAHVMRTEFIKVLNAR